MATLLKPDPTFYPSPRLAGEAPPETLGYMVTFDPTLKAPLRNALRDDVPFLTSIGNIDTLDVDGFIDDKPLRAAYGLSYDADTAASVNPARISTFDPAQA